MNTSIDATRCRSSGLPNRWIEALKESHRTVFRRLILRNSSGNKSTFAGIANLEIMQGVSSGEVHWLFLTAYFLMLVIAASSVIGGARDIKFYSRNGWDLSAEPTPPNGFQKKLQERFARLKPGQIRLLYHLSNFVMGSAWVIGAGPAATRNLLILLN